MKTTFALALALALLACAPLAPPSEEPMANSPLPIAAENTSLATFAGGCFWCMEPPFEHLTGVVSVTSGYAGGKEQNPTYKQVSAGETGHLESIQIVYDPTKITYQQLLEIYWRQIDPADAGGSFVDRGPQYRNAIFYHDDEQKKLAQESKLLVEQRLGATVATMILPFTTFYPAEDYHQDYSTKNPIRYKFYRSGSGRDDYIKRVWFKDNSSLWKNDSTQQCDPRWSCFAKPGEEELKQKLSKIQFDVTQMEGTEAPFQNAYWDNKEPGIYVDVVSGEPLFSSLDKYDSGTGWPSFTKPIEPANLVTVEDKKLWSTRTEVRSKMGDSHLGHVFDDGPKDKGGLRYCMNSASLRFIPVEDLEKEGYGVYLKLFEKT